MKSYKQVMIYPRYIRVHVDTGDLCNVQIMYNAFKYQARLYAPKHEFLFIHVANM